ncbi:MAG TPA: sugar phosphate isomerase/epimerase family protein [Chloroflexota bacterium]|nr:sugar phosphate isomerase/epimerase family protein [Chloroflexota bacterium]
MKLSAMLIDVLRRLPYEENVKWVADAGYQAVDPPVNEPRAGDIARQHGLIPGCAAVGGGAVGTNDADQVKKVRDGIMQAIAWAAGEGVGCLMVPHGRDTAIPTTEQLEGFKQVYGPASDEAQKRGVYLTIENWPNNGRNLMFSPETWQVVFDAVPSEHFGLCFDPSHLVWLGIDYLKAARQFAHKIKYVHGKDTELFEDERNQYGIYGRQFETSSGRGRWWRYRLPGWGVVDWPAFLTVLYDTGYDHIIAIEHEDPVWRGSEEKFKRGLVLARQYLSQYLV